MRKSKLLDNDKLTGEPTGRRGARSSCGLLEALDFLVVVAAEGPSRARLVAGLPWAREIGGGITQASKAQPSDLVQGPKTNPKSPKGPRVGLLVLLRAGAGVA